MLTKKEIVATLDRVQWDFASSRTPANSVHSIHWFPGNFIPQIPSYLVQLLSNPGDVVLDPFCGSGTTGVEALLLNRSAILTDVNHASIQVTEGKVAALTGPNISSDLRSIERRLVWQRRSTRVGNNGEGSATELEAWFHPDTLAQLRYIWTVRESIENSDTRSALDVLFSDTLFACASVAGALTSHGGRRRHHWGWIADNVRPRRLVSHDAIAMFTERVRRLAQIAALASHVPGGASVEVSRQDVRTLRLDKPQVDLIVTSPPYLGMIDYTKANRLTYLWMGWPLELDKHQEIGARYRRKRLAMYGEYERDMDLAVRCLATSLRPGGYCAIVIGATRRYPGAALRVIELFGRELSLVWGPRERIPTKRRVSERFGSNSAEYVCVFRNEQRALRSVR